MPKMQMAAKRLPTSDFRQPKSKPETLGLRARKRTVAVPKAQTASTNVRYL
jgi:hypothetical protein